METRGVSARPSYSGCHTDPRTVNPGEDVRKNIPETLWMAVLASITYAKQCGESQKCENRSTV